MTRGRIKCLLRLTLALTLCVTLTLYYIVGYRSRTGLSSLLLPQGVGTENKLVESTSVLKSSGESVNKSAPQERKTNVNDLVPSTTR